MWATEFNARLDPFYSKGTKSIKDVEVPAITLINAQTLKHKPRHTIKSPTPKVNLRNFRT
jgi:hypothetical protein